MRLRTPRRRSDRQHPQTVLIRATLVLMLIAGVIYVALTAVHGLPGRSTFPLRAEFADAKNIVKNSEVWIAGHRVGTVLGGDARGDTSTLRLSLDGSVDRLPVDSTARVRYTSLLGALVVEITPGTASKTFPENGTIPKTQTSSATQTADVLSALDADRRPKLRATLDTLGQGFNGQGTGLNRTLGVAPDFFTDAEATANGVLAQPGAAQRFFPSLNRLSSAADPVRDAIGEGFEPGARVLDALTPADVERLLGVAPGALSGIRSALNRTDPLLIEAEGFARATQRTLSPAVPALQETTSLLQEARTPLARLRPVLVDAGRSVNPTLALTGRADRLTGRLRAGLTRPLGIMRQFSAHKCDFLTWSRNWRSMLAYGPKGSPVDSDVGPFTGLRVQLEQLGTDQTVGGMPPVNGRQVNAYPEPCTVGRDQAPTP